jgi:hypothetical protein
VHRTAPDTIDPGGGCESKAIEEKDMAEHGNTQSVAHQSSATTAPKSRADAIPAGRCFVTLGRGLEGHGEIDAVMELQRLTLKHGSLPYAKATGITDENTSFGIGRKDGVQLTISGTYDSIIRVEQLYDAERALITAA